MGQGEANLFNCDLHGGVYQKDRFDSGGEDLIIILIMEIL